MIMPSTSNEAQILLAFLALEKDPTLSIRTAAELYEVLASRLAADNAV